jgi:hypothetical protein
MAQQIQFRRDTAANWTLNDPILAIGEMAIEQTTNLFKIGNGILSWSALPYGGLTGANGTNGTNGQNGSVWRTGVGTPSNGLGINGDYYVNISTSDYFLKSAGTYSVVGNLNTTNTNFDCGTASTNYGVALVYDCGGA